MKMLFMLLGSYLMLFVLYRYSVVCLVVLLIVESSEVYCREECCY